MTIRLDLSFMISLYDVIILQHYEFYKDHCSQSILHYEKHSEYLLGDPGYIGENMFIM